MFGPNLVFQAIEKVKVIRHSIKASQSGQKFYVDVRRRDLEFGVEDKVFLRVYLIKRVIRFDKKKKLSP